MTTISINGIPISNAALEQAAMQLNENASPEMVGRTAAIRELLVQRAREKGLLKSNHNEDSTIETLLDLEIKIPERPTKAECLRFYENNLKSFQCGELVYTRHILFAVTPGAPLEIIRNKAEQTLHELMQQPERFAELAREYSNCPSGAQDGNLGQLTRGETVSEFEAVLFDGTDVGIIPRLIKTRYGFHIVSVDHRVKGSQIPFETVHDKIETCLMGRVLEKAMVQYVQILAGQADVRGVKHTAAATPLVQ